VHGLITPFADPIGDEIHLRSSSIENPDALRLRREAAGGDRP
jgi:hypothetical protein